MHGFRECGRIPSIAARRLLSGLGLQEPCVAFGAKARMVQAVGLAELSLGAAQPIAPFGQHLGVLRFGAIMKHEIGDMLCGQDGAKAAGPECFCVFGALGIDEAHVSSRQRQSGFGIFKRGAAHEGRAPRAAQYIDRSRLATLGARAQSRQGGIEGCRLLERCHGLFHDLVKPNET